MRAEKGRKEVCLSALYYAEAAKHRRVLKEASVLFV